MRRIIKGAPPSLLVTYRNNANATFEDMDSNVKDALQNSLLNEQGWVCGYCQQKINTPRRMKIEHHCEQSICNGTNGTVDKRLDYTNMMAVCYGEAGNGVLHCDSSKATFNATNGLPIAVSPWVSAHMNAISYSSTGLVKSSIQRHNNEIDEILKLNAKHLKEMRKKEFVRAISILQPENARNKQKLKAVLNTAIEVGSNKFSNPFPGLYEYMIRKYC